MNFIHVSLGTSLEKMPSTLAKFHAWLIDDKSFEKANEPHVMSKEKLLFSTSCTAMLVRMRLTSVYEAQNP
jgi:hypothetical protein